MANILTTGSAANTGRPTLRNHILKGISLPRLKEGEIKDVTLIPFEIIADDNGEPIDAVYVGSRKSLIVVPNATPTNPDPKAYVRLELQLPDRVYVDNRFDGSGYPIFESHIKQQLKLDEEAIPVLQLLDYLTTHKFSIWITYAQGQDGKTYQNVNYLPPLVKPDTTNSNAPESKDDY